MIYKISFKIFLSLFFISIAPYALSNEASQKEDFKVQWYKPEIGVPKKAKRSTIIFSGQTLPGSKIKINAKKIPLVRKGKIYYIKSKHIRFNKGPVVTDSSGYFELELILPYYVVNLPVKVTSPSGDSKEFQFSFKVKKTKVDVSNQRLTRSPFSRRKWGVWAGSGFNLLKYKQSSSDIPSELNLTTIKGPSYFLKGVWNINQNWSMQATFNLSPGNASSSESITVDQGSYNWIIFSGEATWFPDRWKGLFLGKYKSHLGLDFGLQQHIVPFMARTGASEKFTKIDTNPLTMATLGVQYIIDFNLRWFFETFLRYQYPISSGSLFDINPNFAFDGSLGVVYKWKPQWRTGLFWYGQWHDYNFTHTDKYFSANDPGSNPIKGEQSLFFSNIEFRIGYEFD